MLAIVGGKGGCGKTTTALGVARALATGGRRPVVVDADCDMPNVHTMADISPRPGLGALADGAAPAVVRHRSDAFPGLDVVPAGDASGALSAEVLTRLRRWEPLVVDCPAGASDAVAATVRVADDALVVTTPTPESIEDAAKTARLAATLDARLCGAVVTRSTSPDADRSRARQRLPDSCRVLGTVPEIERDSGDVLGQRVGRAAYERLTQRLCERNI